MANIMQTDNSKSDAVIKQYKIDKCNSKSETITEWQGEVAKFTDANAVVWYYDTIVFYHIDKGKWNELLREDWQNEIVRLRIFDEDKELHIWRSNGTLKGRLREDSNGNSCDYVLAHQVLNWHDSLDNLGFTQTANNQSKVKLITRNYVGYSEIGQAGYVDSRFVGFTNV